MSDFWKDNDPLVHVIAQHDFHDEAFIVGTKEGLERLHKAIGLALESPGAAVHASVMCTDGEGYEAVVRCVPAEKMTESPLGYTESYARDKRRWPDWMRAGLNGRVVR